MVRFEVDLKYFMAEKIIEVKNLIKKFGNLAAVKGVSFQVNEGEVFGILGPNGAGKTTTLEIVETLQQPTEGEITVEGIDALKHPWEVKRRIGVQLQSAGFYPQLTLVELLKMFGAFYDVPVNPIAELKKFQLEDKKKSYFEKLSGGQKQRFSLATTLINKPNLVFLDEPTTGLDPQARVHLWDTIREINKQGVTVVMTTHYMQEAEELCDRIAIMDQGKIIKTGSPKELIEDLLATGFERHEEVKKATLEDVFLHLTGRTIRDE